MCCSTERLSNRDEDDFELFIVLAFEFVEPASEFCVGREQLSEFHKRAHDFDIDGYRALAPQNTRQHGCIMKPASRDQAARVEQSHGSNAS